MQSRTAVLHYANDLNWDPAQIGRLFLFIFSILELVNLFHGSFW